MPHILNLKELKYIIETATKEILAESYGISETVSYEAEMLLDIINNKIRNKEIISKKTFNDNTNGFVKRFYGEFTHIFFNEESLNVNIDIIASTDEDTLYWYLNKYKISDCNIYFSPENRTLNFQVITLTNNLDSFQIKKNGGEFTGILEHEIKHVYQRYLKRGAYSVSPYDNEKMENLYRNQRIAREKSINMSNQLLIDINQCIYRSFKTEQTSLQQQINADIKQNVNNKNQIWQYVKSTRYYQEFVTFKNLPNEIKECENEINDFIKTYYNKDIKWLYKIIKYTIKQMRRTINRAVWYSMSYFSNNLRESFGTKIFNI